VNYERNKKGARFFETQCRNIGLLIPCIACRFQKFVDPGLQNHHKIPTTVHNEPD